MEIEKEVKKMALGHEFGAGAACLKCKDKCEGFELHFWRCVQHLSSFCSLPRPQVTSVSFLLNKKRGVQAPLPRSLCLWNSKSFNLQRWLMERWCVWTIVHAWLVFLKSLTSPGPPWTPALPEQTGLNLQQRRADVCACVNSASTLLFCATAAGFGFSGLRHLLPVNAKICRNCKCGLTEHNVQMDTEENKKVGKLFEDTKYTGLIAKLKKDGIPSYNANMITITLPAPATAHVIPPSASSTLVLPAAAAGVVQPAAAATGAAPSAAPSAAAAAVSATVTPVRANTVPVHTGTTSANVVPVPKGAPMKSVTYEWAPPVANKHLAVRYIELLPPEKRPVAGTEGAVYRRQQMARQLPEHDQDPSKCHELSPAEVKKMQQFVRKYKEEALGVGDVLLPEEMALVQAGGEPGPGVPPGGPGSGPGAPAGTAGGAAASGFRPGSAPAAASGLKGPTGAVVGPGGTGPGLGQSAEFGPTGGATGTTSTAGAMGGAGLPQQNYSCQHCGQPMRLGEPAVYAERAGYDKLWHPACFVCCTCKELLVDMIYFWKKGKLYCGRHYGDSEKPRCEMFEILFRTTRPLLNPHSNVCLQLIFCNEYTQAEGHNWHLKHFCCFDCDCILAGETYVMENDKPVCTPCYMKSYAVKCSSCKNPVDPEAQRVSYGDHHWHAEPQCFQCSGCTKCLIGQRFMAVQGFLFCSVECKKKVLP
uniref:Testin n=1 Tax=Tetraodon nigroviridis TaxID=99883 RepID=H3C656_TETNG